MDQVRPLPVVYVLASPFLFVLSVRVAHGAACTKSVGKCLTAWGAYAFLATVSWVVTFFVSGLGLEIVLATAFKGMISTPGGGWLWVMYSVLIGNFVWLLVITPRLYAFCSSHLRVDFDS